MERAAMNPQAAFGQVNDSIREVAPADLETDVFEFFCECQNVQCHAKVLLTLQEFDARRAALPPVPILAAHDETQPATSRQPVLDGVNVSHSRTLAQATVAPPDL
jgi:hypothetical protein